MKPKVYIETSIPSYLTARKSRDLIIATHQAITQDWWDCKKQNFELFISEFVLNEVSSGNPEAAKLRLASINGILELIVNDEVDMLANILMQQITLPTKARVDALHIAVATVHNEV